MLEYQIRTYYGPEKREVKAMRTNWYEDEETIRFLLWNQENPTRTGFTFKVFKRGVTDPEETDKFDGVMR